MWRAIWVLTVGCVCGISCAEVRKPLAKLDHTTTAPVIEPPAVPRPRVARPEPEDPPIAVGEWLVLTIPGPLEPNRDWVKALQVDSNGDIPLPYVGGTAHVAGLTLGAAERAVADAWWGQVSVFSRIYP